ncbi:MAG: tRNA(Ile)(2)-agmatinylcytidine synthase [Candidatus Bathyarchaeota archaeon]|nr:tRNA(Ile)(2)-agmatinylcytidine synthase [Candidatus Bathyarchaeum tardum]
MVKLHIGFDDTDSPNGGCTTYIAAILVEKLSNIGVTFLDYPRLIRLNPNVPWKTRGNGALCISVECDENLVPKIKKTVLETVETNSKLGYKETNPGIVFVFGEVPQQVKDFATKAKQSMLKVQDAIALANQVNAEIIKFKKGRGTIGGLAAIGEDLKEDHTFEIITYRSPENLTVPRQIQASSVKRMNENCPRTFNNMDPQTGRVLITPRGPDPILCGIRGETAQAVKDAYKMLIINEPVERWIIFRTNQGTDAHLRRVSTINQIQPHNPVVVKGVVSKAPEIIQGGHVIFGLKDETGEVDCAAYKPTVTLCNVARKMIQGDIIKVYGGIRELSTNQLTINLEKIHVLELVPKQMFVNPVCLECGKRMKSMGVNQGFRCDKCGFRSSDLTKIKVNEERDITTGLYITSPRSQRHLTKPHCRYGKEKSGKPDTMIKKWYQF